MKKRIASLVTLIVFLVTFVFSNVDNTKAESEEVVVHTPKNMLDVSVVDNSGNPINGIQMTLVDASGVEVATWTTGSSEVNSVDGSYICGYDNENSSYWLYNWKRLEDVQKLIGKKATIKQISKRLSIGTSQPIYEEGDSLSIRYYYKNGDTGNYSVEYVGDDETVLTLEGGKVATVVDPSYKKGDVSINFTKWQLNDNPGIHIHDMTPGDYSFGGKPMTVSTERTEYVKVRIKPSYEYLYFNDDGTYEHNKMGTVSFPSKNPDETTVLGFCSGSVITVPSPDSDGYVEVYMEKNSRELILQTQFYDSSGNSQSGIASKNVIYEQKRYTGKTKELSPIGTLLLYVPEGSYTVKMSGVPQAYESKDPISVTVADSDETQPLSITLADAHTHAYGTEYKNDATNHWNECACGAKGNVAAHTPGPEATETSPQVCTVCGYEIAPKKTHTHTYGTEYKNDATNHWNECACGAKGNVAAHTPGPEATETSPQVCTVCGYEITPKKPHVHAYGTEYKSDETNHWNECECGAKTGIGEHTYTWVIDKEATQTQEGSKHEVCSVCGYKKSSVTIPVVEITQTGDNNNITLLVVLAGVAFVLMTGVAVYGKRRSFRV